MQLCVALRRLVLYLACARHCYGTLCHQLLSKQMNIITPVHHCNQLSMKPRTSYFSPSIVQVHTSPVRSLLEISLLVENFTPTILSKIGSRTFCRSTETILSKMFRSKDLFQLQQWAYTVLSHSFMCDVLPAHRSICYYSLLETFSFQFFRFQGNMKTCTVHALLVTRLNV